MKAVILFMTTSSTMAVIIRAASTYYQSMIGLVDKSQRSTVVYIAQLTRHIREENI